MIESIKLPTRFVNEVQILNPNPTRAWKGKPEPKTKNKIYFKPDLYLKIWFTKYILA